VTATLADAEKDGVQVPTTLEEYCVKTVQKDDQNEDCILDELDDIDPYDADDINSNYTNSNTDSGNEES
jgi:ubiquitin-conjugating enzyme E2 R